MNRLQRFEYIVLRLVRRFLFNERLARRLSWLVPYYRSSLNESEPDQIITAYLTMLKRISLTVNGKCILEVGAGRTNLIAYALCAAGAHKAIALEPFVAFDDILDTRLRKNRPEFTNIIASRVQRAKDFAEVSNASIDLLLSNSVLEHVTNLRDFFTNCYRLLADNGTMLHLVDYRDHFFKYPYAFLTFKDSVWSRWLDPGDLPRWRLSDHLSAMHTAGFKAEVLTRETLNAELVRVKSRFQPRFAADTEAAVSYAAIFARKIV